MKVYNSIEDFKGVNNPVVTIGMFDGVHIGHQKIIARLNEIAVAQKGESVLLTFYPHPRMVLFPDDNGLEMLNTQNEKIALLDRYGIQHLVVLPFTKEFSRLTSVEFVRDILVNAIHTKWLVIGHNHQFGRNREGTFEQLKELSCLYDFEVEEIKAIHVQEVDVSSTKIRNAVKAGKVKLAGEYLGHLYAITGVVEKGLQLGKTLGYPTANILVDEKTKLIPGDGIYAVKVGYKDKHYGGMLSIGNNPTVENKGRSIEVNIFDFNEVIYGEPLTVYFVERLRDEAKFVDLEALKQQLHQDKVNAQYLLSV